LSAQFDTRATGESSSLDQSTYQLSALAMVDLPLRLGMFVLSPGIGVGYGYLHVVTTHHDPMGNPLPSPSWDHQLRTAAHAALLRPWGEHVSVFADLWADVAALRSDSQFGPTTSLLLSLGLRIEAR
jgi:hypothetical protein